MVTCSLQKKFDMPRSGGDGGVGGEGSDTLVIVSLRLGLLPGL